MPDYGSLYLEESQRICNKGLWLEHELFLGPRADMDEIVAVFEKRPAEQRRVGRVRKPASRWRYQVAHAK